MKAIVKTSDGETHLLQYDDMDVNNGFLWFYDNPKEGLANRDPKRIFSSGHLVSCIIKEF